MIGTIASAVARVSAIFSSVAAGSNLRRRTNVDDSIRPMLNWRKPQAWKSGAAKKVGSRECSGIRERIATIGSIGSGWPREAPFGVPVLPEVSSVIRPGPSGAGTSESSPFWIRCSIESSPGSPSCHATQRRRSPAASPISSANSSS